MAEGTAAGHPARPSNDAGIHGGVKHEGERRSVSAGVAHNFGVIAGPAAGAPFGAGMDAGGIVEGKRSSAFAGSAAALRLLLRGWQEVLAERRKWWRK